MSRSKSFCLASLLAMLLLLFGPGSIANAGSTSNASGDSTPSIDIGDPQFGTGGGGNGCGDPDEFGIYSRPAAPGTPETGSQPIDPRPLRDPRAETETSPLFWLTLARLFGVAAL